MTLEERIRANLRNAYDNGYKMFEEVIQIRDIAVDLMDSAADMENDDLGEVMRTLEQMRIRYRANRRNNPFASEVLCL